jgi:hypothetical protein
MQQEYCDHGHATVCELRRLPLGENANIHVCKMHYHKELAWRKESGSWDITKPDQFPAWETLDIYHAE